MKVFITALLFCSIIAPAFSVQPPRFNYQGKLSDSGGSPLEGSQSCTFWIYEGGTAGVANSGTQRYKETANVTASRGVISHTIGTGTPVGGALASTVFDTNSDLFVQLAVGAESNVILPRQRIESVPFAINAANAEARIPITDISSSGFTISSPGSYYLTGNWSGTGISISASNVVLDLNGYHMAGTGSLGGVVVVGDNITIHNGTITGYDRGITATTGNGSYIHDLIINQSQDYGINVNDDAIIENVVVRNVQSLGSAARGIRANNNSIIRRCTVNNVISPDNSAIGYSVGSSSLIESCVSNGVFGTGESEFVSGYLTGSGCTVRNCIARNASASGTGPSITSGIRTSQQCTVADNICTNNISSQPAGDAYGIFTTSSCDISGNNCSGNVITGFGSGISAGISFGSRSRVRDNVSTNHLGGSANYGLIAAGDTHNGSMILRNCTSGNTTAGIRMENTENANYIAENIADEGTNVSNAPGGANVPGIGDRDNVLF